jgi:pimeloyl-ACP methyl ester carboxylesterase
VVLTGAQLVFVLTALWQLRIVKPEEVTGLAVVGNWVAAAGAGGTLFFLLRRSFGANERRLVGILWDVLTFWPRRFHPLAVRPYSERAVPELEHRLVHHVQSEGRRVILSAHSQGTVLAWAALVQLPDAVTKEVALVTYGSPLRQLHAMAFPAYFNVEAFHALRTRLFDDGHAPSTAWRSLYRRTDYIGKTVLLEPAFEEEVPDPAREPATAGLPPAQQLPSWPDPSRSVWVDIYAHSFYNSEEQLKRLLEDLRGRLK